MKTFKTLLCLALAALMAFGSFPAALAQPSGQAEEPVKTTAEAEETELRDVTGELIFDKPYVGDVETSPEWTIPLTLAAGPVDAAEFVPVSEAGSDW